MNLKMTTLLLLGMMLAMSSGFACNRTPHSANDLPDPASSPATQPDPAATQASQPAGLHKAVFAAGCFWCVEAVFEELKGVSAVVSGYAGGTAENANYKKVSGGVTKHAEVVEITYDPSVITFSELLKVFFSTHDPTQLNRQGPDVGPQYRSAVFYANEQEKKITTDYIKLLNESGVFSKKIATTIEPLNKFYAAETYHQDFYENNPNQPYAAYWIPPKLEKLKKKFPDKLKKD